jgi:phage terminase Nu1 subunit (DNA packaging protein)
MPTMNATNGKGLTWPTSRMAKFIDVTPRRLQQLVQEGVVPKCEGRGRYNPIAVNLAYIRFLRDRVQSPESSDSEFFAVKLAKLRAEREQIELANQITRGKYYERDAVHFLYQHVFRFVTATLKGNMNRVLSHEVLNEIFEEIRNGADDLQAQGDALWTEFEKEIETKEAANRSGVAPGTLGSNRRGNDSGIPATG